MAEDNRQFALDIIQSQQNLVGASVAGGAAAITPQNLDSDSSVGILEQIRDISLKSFRKTTEIAKVMLDSFNYEKNEDRRIKDDAAELAKESKVPSSTSAVTSQQGGETGSKLEGAAFAMGAAIAPIFGFIKKIGTIFAPAFLGKLFGPLTKLFGKGGFLFRFLGPLGPIGLIIGGVALLFKYSDEIVKSLTPAIESIKKLAQENAPLITALKNGFDFLFKNIIGGLGRVITGIIDDIGPIFSGFSKLLQGDIMGGLKDLGKGLLNIVLTPISAILRFFEPVLAKVEQYIRAIPENIANFFIDLRDQAIENARNNIQAIKDTFSGVFDKIKNSVIGFFAPIGDFFTGLVDNVKSFINNIIESLPLPNFLKKKLKLETKATREADERINESGVKGKYADESITGMQRERMTGGGATMNEAFNEVAGENYGEAIINNNGFETRGILTPAEFSEYNKLDTNGQMDYLKNLDAKEQERRRMIEKLMNEKITFDNKNRDYIAKYKTAPDEMMSPDDKMLRDSKFQREAKNQAKGLVGDSKSGNQTVIVNNQPMNVTSSNDVKKADMYSGNINTSAGDSYFERNIEGYL